MCILWRAGISKFACVGYGWGADPLWPLAQSGAVDAWAVIHGHINRGFIRQVKTPGIVQVSDVMLSAQSAPCASSFSARPALRRGESAHARALARRCSYAIECPSFPRHLVPPA